MINFLHTFNPQPILFQLGFLKIHWYGVFIVLGIACGLFVVLKLAKKVSVSSDEIFDLGFYAIIFSLIGARVYAVFLELDFYLSHPFEIIAVWHGGLAIHGAIIGGVSTVLVYCYFKKKFFWLFADLVAPALALGQAIGRFGNYFNQELFGGPTNLPWGIPIALQNRPEQFLNFQYFHPTFLSESVLNFFNFCFLVFLFLVIKGKYKVLGIKYQGVIFLVYLINYSLIRICMEILRQDPTPEFFGVRLPILVSLLIIISSATFIIFKLKKPNFLNS